MYSSCLPTVFACQSCLHAMLLILPNNWINFWKKSFFSFFYSYLDINICFCWCVMLWLLALKFKCKAKRSQLDKTHRPYGWLLFLVNVTIVTIILIIVNMQMSFAVSHIFLRKKKLVFRMWKFFVMIIVKVIQKCNIPIKIKNFQWNFESRYKICHSP